MLPKLSPFWRSLLGSLVGGSLAAFSTAVFFLLLVWLFPQSNASHHLEGDNQFGAIFFMVQLLALFTFLAGLFIGMRGIDADSWKVFRWPVAGTYAVATFLCLIGSTDFREFLGFAGLITPGIFASCAGTLFLARWLGEPSEVEF